MRSLKGSLSYEQFVAQLMREKSEPTLPNQIEFTKFERKERVLYINDYMIIYEYNAFNRASGHFFDIILKKVRKNGKAIELKNFLENYEPKRSILERSYFLYFKIIESIIKEEIEPIFKHNGRFEDYFSWENEFNALGLSKNSFENDVMIKLRKMSQGADWL
jgi:hypothetical protein